MPNLMGVRRIRHHMLKLTVRFASRDDGGLRAWCDDLPGFVLSHSDAQAVINDVEPVLEAMLAAKYGWRSWVNQRRNLKASSGYFVVRPTA